MGKRRRRRRFFEFSFLSVAVVVDAAVLGRWRSCLVVSLLALFVVVVVVVVVVGTLCAVYRLFRVEK